MADRPITIAVVAPSCTLDPVVASQLDQTVTRLYASTEVRLKIHPQCYLSEGHFAGSDAQRVQALLQVAHDPQVDAVWLARGGYGAARAALLALPQLQPMALAKTWMGYSDGGALLAGLYALGADQLFHGPMPSDLKRDHGHLAVERALSWLVRRQPAALEPSLKTGMRTAAFNLTVFSQLLGTPLEPDLADHVLMLEDVSEYMYRLDRSLCHITSNPNVRRVAGLALGDCTEIPANKPDFVLNEEQIAIEWCTRSAIDWRGRVQIGHNANNHVVPIGRVNR